MKLQLLAAILPLAFFCVAEDFAPPPGEEGVLPVHPSRFEEWNRKTGGMVRAPRNGRAVLVADGRTDDTTTLTSNIVGAVNYTMLPFRLQRITLGTNANPYSVGHALLSEKHPFVLLFVEKTDYPSISAFPEEGLAIVNVAAFKCADRDKYALRLMREFWRGLGFALGAYGNMTVGDVLQPIRTLDELDNIRGRKFSPMRLSSVSLNALRHGVYSQREMPYNRACREGWAPPPTNSYQKAIWERIRAEKERGPTNPIIIKPPNGKK